MCVTSITPIYWRSRIWWYLISICLVRWWYSGFRTRRTALWLSHRSGVGAACLCPTSSSSWRNQVMSLAVELAATYSASVVDREVHFCFLLAQATGPPFSISTVPLMERRSCFQRSQNQSMPLACSHQWSHTKRHDLEFPLNIQVFFSQLPNGFWWDCYKIAPLVLQRKQCQDECRSWHT
jgi:hypothetical protein